jgi:predicted O-methyltransferase YrrM
MAQLWQYEQHHGCGVAMDAKLEDLLTELERFGQENDKATSERARRMLNITRDTGQLLAVLVRAAKARAVLEIGTSNGYSTLWLADAAQAVGGKVTTVEMAAYKLEQARANFARAELSEWIEQVAGDAAELLGKSGDAAFDFVFLDSERSEYVGWWPDLQRVLRPGGLLVVDNAISHAAEMAPFMELVRADAGFTTSLVPVGNGEFLAVKPRRVGS